MSDLGLGRLPQQDERDAGFLAKAALSDAAQAEILTGYKYWSSVHWNDQGDSGMCVGFNSINWWEDGPITHPHVEYDPIQFYQDCCLSDSFPANDNGDPDYGTTVHASGKVMKSRGWISSYLWGQDLMTIVNWLRMKGPVLAGTNWYYSMFDTQHHDGREFIEIDDAKGLAGGHCYIWDGVNIEQKVIRAKLGSWKRGLFGDNGYGWLSFDTAARLIAESGEFMMALEVAE